MAKTIFIIILGVIILYSDLQYHPTPLSITIDIMVILSFSILLVVELMSDRSNNETNGWY